MIKIFTEFVKYFMNITTGILIICAVNSFGTEMLSGKVLWQILIAGAGTALLTTIIYNKEVSTTKGFVLMTAVHYILLCVIMIIIGITFDWMSFNLSGIIMMVISVALVYVFTFFGRYIIDKKEADSFNKALKNKYKD